MTASTSFKVLRGLDWLPKRDVLPSSVPSARFSRQSDWIRAGEMAEEGSRLARWFPDIADREVEEDVVGLGSYGRLLTVLVTEELKAEEDAQDDEPDDYIDRWKRGVFRSKKG